MNCLYRIFSELNTKSIYSNSWGVENETVKDYINAVNGAVQEILPLLKPNKTESKDLVIRCTKNLYMPYLATVFYGVKQNVLLVGRASFQDPLSDSEERLGKKFIEDCSEDYSLENVEKLLKELEQSQQISVMQYVTEEFTAYCKKLPNNTDEICSKIIELSKSNSTEFKRLVLFALATKLSSVMNKTTCKANLFHELTHHLKDDHRLSIDEFFRRTTSVWLTRSAKAMGTYCLISSVSSYIWETQGYISSPAMWTGTVLLCSSAYIYQTMNDLWRKNVLIPELKRREIQADQSVINFASNEQLASFSQLHRVQAIADIFHYVAHCGCDTVEKVNDAFKEEGKEGPHGNLLHRLKRIQTAYQKRMG